MVDNPPKGQNPPDKQPPPATDPQPSDLAKAIKDRLLSIDPSVALDCANACDVAIGKLLFVKQKFADSAPLPVLGAPGSGKDLRDEVNKRTAAIIEVLDGYVKGTTTLGENFLAAGKAFTTTDNSNADVLKQLDVKKMTTVPKDFGYDPIAYNKPDTKVPDDKPSGGSDPSVRIALEAASHMDWNQLFEVRQILGGSPSASQKVWDTYALWEWGKRSVDTMRRDLSQTLATAIASKWKGDAADAAAKFSKKYADNFGGVAESMENYSKTLKYVSEYLYTTHEAMPPVDEATARTGTGSTYSYTAASAAGGPGVTTYTNRYNVECDLPKFQKNFQEHYLDGLTNTKPGLVQFTPPSNTGPGPGPGNTTDAPPPNDGTQTGPGPGTSDLDKYKDDLQKLLSGPGPGLGELGGPGGPGGLSAPNVDVPPPPSFGSSDAAGPGGSSVPDIGVPDGPGIGGGSSVPDVSVPNMPGLDGNSPDATLPGGPGPGPDGRGAPGGSDMASRAAQAAAQGAQAFGALSQADKMRAAELAARNNMAKALGGLPGKSLSGGPGGRPGGLGGVPGSPLSASQNAKLFPRVALPGVGLPGGAASSGAGLAGSGMGAPGAPGGANAGQKDSKQHKRAKYLDSKAHLDEAFGPTPTGMKPVIEPGPAQ